MITEEFFDHYKAINAALVEACRLAFIQPKTERHYALMTDDSFRASGSGLMIETSNEKKLNFKKKTFAPVSFGSKVFSPAQLKFSFYCKEFLAIYPCIPRIPRVHSHLVGNNVTTTRNDRQTFSHTFLFKPHPRHFGTRATLSYISTST